MQTAPTNRLVSLDVLRGVTVALMILVNNNGDSAHTWPILEHAPWNGFTLADFVFPCFLFIAGVSIQLSLGARLARGVTRASLLPQLLRRSAVIFACGLFIAGFPFFHLHTWRIYGVLQRIALCLLFSSLLMLYTRTRAIAVTVVALLVGYWVLLRFVPIPGLGVPLRDVPLLDPFANLASWLDRAIFPTARLYRQGVYDPCGLLGTLPAIASTLLGVLTGKWLRAERSPARKLRGLLAAAAVCMTLALVWAPWFPINKRLWTSSYVLFAGGLALAAFALFYWWLDVRGGSGRWFTPARVFGCNALASYILAELLDEIISAIRLSAHHCSLRRALYEPLMRHISNPEAASLAYAVLFVAVCWLPMAGLYRRRIFIKI